MQSEDSHSTQQTLEDVLSGQEPTEAFLEELRVLNEADDVSEWDLTQQALALTPEETTPTESTELDYKTNESHFSMILIVAIAFAGLYWFTK